MTSLGRMDEEPGALAVVLGSALSYAAGLGFVGFMLQSAAVPEEGGGLLAPMLHVAQGVMPLPLAGAIIGAVGGAIHGWIRHQRAHEHYVKLQRAAATLGAEYFAWDTQLDDMLRPYFAGTSSVTCSDLLRMGPDGMDLVIADVYVTTASGHATVGGKRRGHRRNTRETWQTAAFAKAAGASIPEFVIQPGGALFDVASRIMGGKDLDFPSHPGFSKRYHVTAMDETALRRILTPQVLTALEKATGITLSGRRDGVLLFRRGVLVDPDQLGPFARSAKSILSQVIGAAKAAA